jgi:hypothetical protein
VVGEIFNILPFAAIANYWIQQITNLFMDPLVLATTLLDKLVLDCAKNCFIEDPSGNIRPGIHYNICAGLAITSELGRTIKTLTSLQSVADIGSVSNTWCDQFDEALADYNAEKEAG